MLFLCRTVSAVALFIAPPIVTLIAGMGVWGVALSVQAEHRVGYAPGRLLWLEANVDVVMLGWSLPISLFGALIFIRELKKKRKWG